MRPSRPGCKPRAPVRRLAELTSLAGIFTTTQQSKQAVVVGVLGMFATAAVLALVIAYLAYLPTIASVPLRSYDAWLAEVFYRVARNCIWISGARGLALGFSLPVCIR